MEPPPLPPKPATPTSEDQAFAFAREIAQRVADMGGRAFLVGGAVRDRLRSLPVTDLDVEVFGLEPDVVHGLLAGLGRVDGVGKAFGIFKVSRDDVTIDVGLPRTEATTGPGHREFAIRCDPRLDIATAASRRDLTINAIFLDPLTGEIVDPWHGRADLEAGILRHVSAAFAEDPLRVLRVVQFAARFEFAIAPETAVLCRSIDLSALPRERIAGEIEKWLVRGKRPSLGLAALYATGAVRLFPELPNGDADDECVVSCGERLDALIAARNAEPSTDAALALMLAGLAGPELAPAAASALFARLTIDHARGHRAAELHAAWPEAKALAALAESDPSALPRVCRLSLRAGIRPLAALLDAEAMAHRTANESPRNATPPGARLLALGRAAGVAESPPRPFLLGRDVLALGIEPGPRVGALLDRVFQAQLDGTIGDRDGALALLRTFLATPP